MDAHDLPDDLVAEPEMGRRMVLRGLGGAGFAALLGTLLAPAVEQAAAQPAGTPTTTPSLDAVAALPGVIVAIEWDNTGKLVASSSKFPVLPKRQLELAAGIGALLTNAFPLAINLYSEVLGMKWAPARWIAAAGGNWLLIFGANQRAVLAEAATAGLPEIFAALGGTPSPIATPTP